MGVISRLYISLRPRRSSLSSERDRHSEHRLHHSVGHHRRQDRTSAELQRSVQQHQERQQQLCLLDPATPVGSEVQFLTNRDRFTSMSRPIGRDIFLRHEAKARPPGIPIDQVPGYSCLRHSTGSRAAARLAGKVPNAIPTEQQARMAINALMTGIGNW